LKQLICPFCGGKFRLEEATTEEIYLTLGRIQGKLDRYWPIIDEYIDCFARSPQGIITIKHRVRRAAEILKLFESQEFEHQGKRYRTNRPEIIKAMTEICNAAKSGFTNHNYLKVILKKSAEKLSAEGVTAREETEREKRRRGESEQEDIGLKEALGRYPKLKNALERFGKE